MDSPTRSHSSAASGRRPAHRPAPTATRPARRGSARYRPASRPGSAHVRRTDPAAGRRPRRVDSARCSRASPGRPAVLAPPPPGNDPPTSVALPPVALGSAPLAEPPSSDPALPGREACLDPSLSRRLSQSDGVAEVRSRGSSFFCFRAARIVTRLASARGPNGNAQGGDFASRAAHVWRARALGAFLE